MRKLKEGDYFEPKNEAEYDFIFESLERLGYRAEKSEDLEVYKNYPLIVLTDYLGFVATNNNYHNFNEKLTLHDLFTEEVETFEVDQKVLVRDIDTEPWKYDRYGRYEETNDLSHICVGGDWKYCIDYETNKEKHGKV